MLQRRTLIEMAVAIGLVLTVAMCLFQNPSRQGDVVLHFAGGPVGSTSQDFANEFSRILSRKIPGIKVRVRASAGSSDNLHRVEKGKIDLALVSAEDSYRGALGTLPDGGTTQNAVALTHLFSSFAQLIVLKGSPFESPLALKYKRIAIGNPSSDSALSAMRYFQGLAIWDEIVPIYIGHKYALQELIDGSIEAVWMMSNFPNNAVWDTNKAVPLRLVSLWDDALAQERSSDFFEDFPFYFMSIIPAGSYHGQTSETLTIGTSVLLVTNHQLDATLARNILEVLFSDEGIAKMRYRFPDLWQLDRYSAQQEIYLPLHPGAVSFFMEHD